MSIARPFIIAAALAGAPGALAQSYPGQQIQTVPRPTPDADALAGAMRRLGANPRDLSALLEAAELSLRLGDVNAAASLLKRAENVDPMNGRVKAGMARILVTQERPGEALRYFDQAIGYGLDAKSFAGDRGLAYDLVGEQERAQRDYRVALKSGSNDEVERRYALSLGISGKRQEALDVIDDQVRRNDRSAWRVRAFVLALTGDVPGAEKIANTMMPPGMGAALAPFFSRVAGLPAADRAFAVHFGELRPTPQRLADARMVPPLPPLVPEVSRPVQVAAAPAAAPKANAGSERRSAREDARRRRELAAAERRASRTRQSEQRTKPAEKPPVAVAAASSASVRRPANEPTAFEPPRYAGVAFAPPQAVVQPVPTAPVDTAAETASASPRPATPLPQTPSVPTTGTAPAAAPVQLASSTPSTPRPVPTRSPALTPSSPSPSAVTAPQPTAEASVPTSIAATPPLNPAPVQTAAETTASTPTAATPAVSEDTILARIMAGISIPGSELGIAPVRPPAPEPEPVSETAARVEAAPPAVADATATKAAADLLAAGDQEKAITARKAAEAAAKKAAADAKAAAAKKLADAKKQAEAKKAAEEKAAAAKAAKAEPARIWVQVAGGANKDDLPKAWAAAQSKAEALKGKSAYTTPLRATNRVVTGPFKSDAEAREFVNTLAKQGLSAFPFTSDDGQKMTRLPAK
ncbi:SPOR domain-containing protein [Sphingomonas dokdonensis]|uniref:Sporulation related domain protein n=1 Tax=Sphingomonas dokdonensis TaxID=344880 RepID=A0A245ZP82_9SPHN|nr:SPOR domain-containing protein [Sphingomonas dokdonensis]OWK31545.1 sporulation related domain protein [Sphingomonas dokdonensis]